MKTAEQTIAQFMRDAHGLKVSTIAQAMRKYAKQVAEQALKDAAENAEVTFEGVTCADNARVDEKSILNTEIKLP